MPAEWEPHDAMWMTWPQNSDTWHRGLELVEDAYAAMIRALIPGEVVCLLVNDTQTAEHVRRRLHENDIPIDRVCIHELPTNDAWIRDYGPNFVVNGESLALNNWGFNSWGGKYPPWNLDNAVPMEISRRFAIRAFSPDVVLEGGSIDVNGSGSLLTTESCLLNMTRNPALSRQRLEGVLRDFLGVRRVLWLNSGIIGDDTDGHVDDLARFVNPTTVVAVVEDDPTDVNYEILCDNMERLLAMKDQDGRPLDIVTLPMPEPVVVNGVRLPASYANFTIANACVLVPVFGQDRDETALNTLTRLFPTRRIVPIPGTELVVGLGACHCLTQQQPTVA
jgi:agmatine deiminase